MFFSYCELLGSVNVCRQQQFALNDNWANIYQLYMNDS